MRSVVLWVAGAVLAQAAPAQEPAPSPVVPFLAAIKQPEPGNVPSPVFTEPTAVYVGGTNPVLNLQEAAGVGITRAWEQKSYEAMVQTPGTDGAIQFHYGQSLPVIVCGMLQVTDVELQPGELVNEKPYLGDSERWVVESAVSGSGPTQTQHLIIKPRDVGLQTSLVVPTDRRTYHFLLLSHATEFMHHVTFLYGDKPPSVTPASVIPPVTPKPETAAGGAAVKVAYESPASAPPSPRQLEGKGTASKARDEEDEYEISGKAPWKPLSAYHTTRKTFIEMPRGMDNTEAPVLFLLRKCGPFGLGSQKLLVNFRVHGHWFVVDSIIDRAVLVAGVGSNQDKVLITRNTTGR